MRPDATTRMFAPAAALIAALAIGIDATAVDAAERVSAPAPYPAKPIRLIAAQPAGGNTDIVARLQREIAQIAKLDVVRERLIVDGLEPSEATPKEFDEHLVREITKWTRLAKAARISIN
jgi:tripartite-type tricarboxylate transporter receptor subunit TctC